MNSLKLKTKSSLPNENVFQEVYNKNIVLDKMQLLNVYKPNPTLVATRYKGEIIS